ncbi:MAG: alpha/beta hydrolase [Dehalococcoidia bacterium]
MVDVQKLLDPEIAQALAAMPARGTISAETLPMLRDQRNLQMAAIQLSDAVERKDYLVRGPAGSPDVVVRVHWPKGATGALPCIYSIHGGGYILGTYEMDDLRFDKWCVQLNCVGVSVEYRLAPETPYPGPLEDCYVGLKWTYENAAMLGVDPKRLGISGASAGGGLAAGLALLARDRGEVPLAFQNLIYPMIDDTVTSVSSQWEVPIWNPAANRYGWAAYLGPLAGTDKVPGYAAASRATDLKGLPPALIIVGALDGFLSEDVEYAMRLTAAEVPTELHVYPGAPHGFDGIVPGTGVARRARRDMEEWLVRVL